MPQEKKFTPTPEKEQCVHGNKIVTIDYRLNSMYLGNETARCPYMGRVKDFNPYDPQTMKVVCFGGCKVTRQNKMVEKLAYDKVKIYTRIQASRAQLPTAEEEQEKSIEDATKGD